jgi:hypothetical protein
LKNTEIWPFKLVFIKKNNGLVFTELYPEALIVEGKGTFINDVTPSFFYIYKLVAIFTSTEITEA